MDAPKDVVVARPGAFLTARFAPDPHDVRLPAGLLDGFVSQPNGSFDAGFGLAPAAPGSSAAALVPIYPPMQLFHGLFGRTLPDSAWASDHCLVTAGLALEPRARPPSRSPTQADKS